MLFFFVVAANITFHPPFYVNITSPSTATFTCTASGLPRPNITWMDPDNNTLLEGDNIFISMEVENRVINSTLHVMRTSASVSGTYTCSTDNSIIGRGDVTSISTILTVHGEIN